MGGGYQLTYFRGLRVLRKSLNFFFWGGAGLNFFREWIKLFLCLLEDVEI